MIENYHSLIRKWIEVIKGIEQMYNSEIDNIEEVE